MKPLLDAKTDTQRAARFLLKVLCFSLAFLALGMAFGPWAMLAVMWFAIGLSI